MKSKLITGAIALLTIIFVGCEDVKFGDAFLEKAQSEEINLDTVFSKKIYAEQALSQVYMSLPYGLLTGEKDGKEKLGLDLLECLTDLNSTTLTYGGGITEYYSGTMNSSTNPSKAKYSFISDGGWKGIRDAYVFIENIDRVPDMTSEDKLLRKAEAKMIIAIHYAEMFRHFGGLPLVTKSYAPSDVPDLKRMTAEQTLNHIISLLDEVSTVLPWTIANPVVDDGRMTAAGAMGLKIRILLFAASPLFNDDTPFLDGKAADDKLVWFGSKKNTRWNDVVSACEAFISRLNAEGGYMLVNNTGTPRTDFRKAYYERNNAEVLISTRKGYKKEDVLGTFFTNTAIGLPTLDYVDMFPMADGSNFDWNNPVHAEHPFFDVSGNPVRDPRLYESVLINGDDYQGRKAELYIGGRERTVENRSSTGFMMRKFRLDEESATGTVVHWPYLRLPEIFLTYAEALNEANGAPTELAYNMLDKTRDRVGVGRVPRSLDHIAFREAVLRERALEFGYEEVRFFDMIRWKRDDIFRKKLHGLTINRTVPPDNNVVLSYEKYEILQIRDWQNRWNTKWYLTAFPIDEINKGYGLIQNPGW
ncbi:MAG: RagB/SusD family nutrient uptake outer membrane protein [Paludibacter sp.]|nr:RagB/SusD family nutrient uptake outer membrane protein [Paludibacter sp.]